MIEVRNIKKSYGTLEVLHGVSLSVSDGEIVSIVGASGAGKSTLLQIMGSLMSADSGEVIIDGVSIAGLGDDALSEFRNRHIGFIFQSVRLPRLQIPMPKEISLRSSMYMPTMRLVILPIP